MFALTHACLVAAAVAQQSTLEFTDATGSCSVTKTGTKLALSSGCCADDECRIATDGLVATNTADIAAVKAQFNTVLAAQTAVNTAQQAENTALRALITAGLQTDSSPQYINLGTTGTCAYARSGPGSQNVKDYNFCAYTTCDQPLNHGDGSILKAGPAQDGVVATTEAQCQDFCDNTNGCSCFNFIGQGMGDSWHPSPRCFLWIYDPAYDAADVFISDLAPGSTPHRVAVQFRGPPFSTGHHYKRLPTLKFGSTVYN
jgi:hypothetical protein